MLNTISHWEMQIKTTVRYHFTPIRITTIRKEKQQKTNTAEDMEKLEFIGTVGGNIKWCSHSGKVCQFLKKLNTDLPYDLANALIHTQNRSVH